MFTQNVMDEESSQSTHLMNMSCRQTVDSNILTSTCVILAYDSASTPPLCFTLNMATDAMRDWPLPYKIGLWLDDFTQWEVNERTLSLLRVRWG